MSRRSCVVLAWCLATTVAGGAGRVRADEGRFLIAVQAGSFDPTGFADSYDAVYGDALVPVGGRFEWALHPRLALALSSTVVSASGEQIAILPGEPPQPTGIGTRIELNPWHLTLSWRIHPEGPWSGTVGLGPTLVRYSEKSEFEELSSDEVGGHASASVRRAFGRFVVGAELLYASIPDALGEGGAAALFDESDLGGITGSILFGYTF